MFPLLLTAANVSGLTNKAFNAIGNKLIGGPKKPTGGGGDGSTKPKPLPQPDYPTFSPLPQIPTYSPPPIPRLASFNVSDSWAAAQRQAEAAVSPIYAEMWNRFVNQQQADLRIKQEDTTTAKGALDLALARLMEDTGTQRARTEEDTLGTINELDTLQNYSDRTGGLEFDNAVRALTEGTAAAGLGESGLGQQRVENAQMMRRTQSNEEVRQTTNKMEAANTLMNRSFQDLERKETRAGEDTATGKTKLDLDLERFVQQQGRDADRERAEQELQKQTDIINRQTSIQKSLVDQWIQSLAGKGYNSQEIALAAQVYGR